MKHFFAPLLGFFLTLPFMMSAGIQHADTIGMKVSRTYRTIQTTIFVEQTIDSIVSLDSLGMPNVVSFTTFDTLVGSDTTAVIDTSFFVTQQVKFWRLESRNEVAITQIFRGYWQAGTGNDDYSVLLSNQSFANYSRGSSTWRTDLLWRYGTRKQATNPWNKSSDVLNLQSRYGFRASPTWNYSAQFRFETQLTKTYPSATNRETYISRFLSPATSSFAIGMEYVNTQNRNAPNWISLLLSPTNFRATYVRDTDTNIKKRFNVPIDAHWASTFGALVQMENSHRLPNNISLKSNLTLFLDYLTMTEMEKSFLMDWKFNFDIRLSRHFTLGFETWLIYNPNQFFERNRKGDDIERSRRWQFQQSLMLRFVYQIAASR